MGQADELPGELLTCELCGQQPESIAFIWDECREKCPFGASRVNALDQDVLNHDRLR
jgi:ferredoxin